MKDLKEIAAAALRKHGIIRHKELIERVALTAAQSAYHLAQSEQAEIPMSEILDEPRKIAVAFADVYIDMRDTVKLASDIQNYAVRYAKEQADRVKELEERLEAMQQNAMSICETNKQMGKRLNEIWSVTYDPKISDQLCRTRIGNILTPKTKGNE